MRLKQIHSKYKLSVQLEFKKNWYAKLLYLNENDELTLVCLETTKKSAAGIGDTIKQAITDLVENIKGQSIDYPIYSSIPYSLED